MNSSNDAMWTAGGAPGSQTVAGNPWHHNQIGPRPGEATPPPAGPRHALVYDGSVGDLYQLFLRNTLLILATGGIYYFWGKVRLRQYLWSRLSLDGHRFEFHGKGGEMFAGFLMVLIGLFAWGVISTAVEFTVEENALIVRGALGAATFILIFYLAFVAQFSAQRYRLTRTRWRGIGGGMQGSAFIYALKASLLMLLLPLTAFQARPFVSLRLLTHRLNRTWIGDRALSLTGVSAADIYGRYFLACLGVIGMSIVVGAVIGVVVYLLVSEASSFIAASLGLEVAGSILGYVIYYFTAAWVMAGFWARYWTYVGGKLHWGEVGFEIDAPRRVFVRHRVWHLLAVTLTLGLAYPWALHRIMQFFAEHVALRGDLAVAKLQQTELKGAAIGEGLINAFDPGFI